MDNELFKKKLSEVANWGLPTLEQSVKSTGLSKNRRGRKPKVADVTEEQEEQEEQEIGVVKDGTNVTYAPMVTSLKVQSCQCEDCGKFCENGRKKEGQIYFKRGRTYIREKCLTCKKHKDPYTGKFTLSHTQSSSVWHKYMGAKTEKRNITKRIIAAENGRLYEEEENDQEIIKKYLD